MSHEIRVYRDNAAGAVIFKNAPFGERFTNVLSATLTDEDTINVTEVHTGTMLMSGIGHASIKKQDGSDAGVDVLTVIDYLNAEFAPQAAGGGIPPVITSPLNVTAISGTPFNYAITATNSPIYFSADNLPAGLVIDHFTGIIFGTTTVVGAHAVTITAVNGFGVDIETLTLTVQAAGGFTSTVGTRFRDSYYKNHVKVNTSAAIERTSAQPWSVSMWFYLDTIEDQDFWSFGSQNNHIYLGVTAEGAISVRFRTSNSSVLDMEFANPILPIPALAWHHLTVTNDGSNTPAGVRVFVDNIERGQTVLENTLSAPAGGSNDFRIARASGSTGQSNWLDGYIDEWSYYSSELTPVDTAAIYNAGTPTDLLGLPSAASLQVWFRMGDGDTFPTLTDHSVAGIHTGTMVNMTVANFVNFVP